MKKRIASVVALSILMLSSCGSPVVEETTQNTKAVSMENLDYAETSATEDEEGEITTTVTDESGNSVTLLIESGTSTEVVGGGGGGGYISEDGVSTDDSTPDKYTDFEIEPVKDLTFGKIKVSYYYLTEALSDKKLMTTEEYKKLIENEGYTLTDEQLKSLEFSETPNGYIRTGLSQDLNFGECPYLIYNQGVWCGGYVTSYLEKSDPLVIKFEQSDKCNWHFNFSAFEQKMTTLDGSEINDSLVLTNEEKEKEDDAQKGHYYLELMKNGKIIRNPNKYPKSVNEMSSTDVKAVATTLGDFEYLTNAGDALYYPKNEIIYYVDVKGEKEPKELKVGMSYKSLEDQIGKGIKVETTETNDITGEVVDKTYYIYKTDDFTLIVETFNYEDVKYASGLEEDAPDDTVLVKTIILLDNEFEYREEEEETTSTDVPADPDAISTAESSAETTVAA